MCLLALTACGGGGGDSPGGSAGTPGGSGSAPVPAPDPVAQTDLQTSVPAPTYPAGSTTLTAFTTLNAARQAYGVGLRAQNPRIDAAAANHAKYMLHHWGIGDFANTGHQEDKSKPGYTGAWVDERLVSAGYLAGPAGEALTSIIAVDGVESDPGAVSINSLLSAPYHRFGILNSTREVGFADASARFPNEGGVNHMFVVAYGTLQGQPAQLPAKDWLGMWPVPGAVDVMYSFSGETPDPIPVNKGECAGYPVSVQVHPSLVLATTSFTLAEAGSGAPVSVQLSTRLTDANPAMARDDAAYIIPYRPLKLNTRYTARFVGSAGTMSIDKSWSFTTGSTNTRLIYGCNPG